MTEYLAYAFENIGDITHGKDHILRVLNSARKIAESYPEVDTEALECACALHDCGRPEQVADPSVAHAAAGAVKAERFLLGIGRDASFAGKAARIIAAHSSPELARKAGLEGMILFDADKLEMTGAVGLSRALLYAADAGEPLYTKAGASFYAEAAHDMAFARDNLFTPEARRMAEKRIKLMEDFLASLASEADCTEE